MSSRFLRDQRGGVVTIFAISLPVIVVAVGAAVDYSELSRNRAGLQKIADEAALAGAKVLASDTGQLPGTRQDEARAAAIKVIDGQFGANAASLSKIVTPSVPGRTVKVELEFDKDVHFASFLGRKTQIGASATAIYDAQSNDCMIALGQFEGTGINLIGSAKINAPKCSVKSNATGPESIRTQGAARITADDICAAGGTGRADTSPPAKSQCNKTPDPYNERSLKCGKDQSLSCGSSTDSAGQGNGGQGGSGNNAPTVMSSYAGPCDFTNYRPPANANGTVTLRPGVYCGGLSVQGNYVMEPGFYQIQDGPLSLQANASLTGSGVSILLSGNNAVLDLQGSPKLTLSAMTTGPLAGIAISSNTTTPPVLTSKLQGSPDVSLTGSLWLPGQTLRMQGSPKLSLEGPQDKMVAYSFFLRGSPDLIIKADNRTNSGSSRTSVRLIQ
jgi:Flp pilus assembly protein TadG